jgi:hypothetical protein
VERWGAELYGNPCRACGFQWDLAPQEAVTVVAEAPAQFRTRLESATGRERHPDLGWTPAAYVVHVADNLRIWAERLAGAGRGEATEVPGYDPDLLATARGYETTTLASALWSLDWSARAWVEAMNEALAIRVVLQHANRGPQRAEDVARSNAHDAHHHLGDIDRILG